MKEIVICGANNRWENLYTFVDYLSNELKTFKIIAIIDKNTERKTFGDTPVFAPEDIANINPNALFIVLAETKETVDFYEAILKEKNYIVYNGTSDIELALDIDKTTINREICAFLHINGMDKYFDEAESEELLNIFWAEGSIFKRLFNELDLSNVIEIACGRGRHVPKYINQAGHITLVDILQKNIDICKARFGDDKRITYYKNQGYNVEQLKTGEYTSIFSYDSMVHFELLDINSYLYDFYRVLKSGGRALIHHSNIDAMYNISNDQPLLYGRSFMNYKIFSYLATHAGFIVLDQHLLRWHSKPDVDCVTLLEKPAKNKSIEAVYGKTLKF